MRIADAARVRPMLATTGEVPLSSPLYAYEPKYDGIRALVLVTPSPSGRKRIPARPAVVHIWSRLGNEKTRQFPEIVAGISQAFAGIAGPCFVDGEIVALDAQGEAASFLHLQNRGYFRAPTRGGPRAAVAFVAFDLLVDGDTDIRSQPLRERRVRLERLFKGRTDSVVRLSEQVVGKGDALRARAEAHGWEGMLAKRLDSRYLSGKRSPDWCKVKLVRHQTCVIGGWTDPRGARPRFGALLLGVYDDHGALHHVGQVGAGFSGAELDRVWTLLQRARATHSPFLAVPRALQQSHWTTPTLVCEIKFTEWTLDGKLRHPTYLGVRDDVEPRSVRQEPQAGETRRAATGGRGSTSRVPSGSRPTTAARSTGDAATSVETSVSVTTLLAQLDRIQGGSGNGTLQLPRDERLEVTNLRKVFWPALKLTKGDLFRHYVRVAQVILPVLADRPLVMKRYPNGIDAKPFYQHRATAHIPSNVRVETVEASDGPRPHIVGSSLLALLYTTQLASISQDPWFSRVGTPDAADFVAFDLDPPDELPFRRVLDMALYVRDELAGLGADAFAKTSGSRGVHVFVSMPPGTPFEAAGLFAQIVATIVARKHPRLATVERTLSARGQRVYIDYLQNARGKTLASAYSARANAWAGVSTPLTWQEVETGVTPQDFTVATFGSRLDRVGDLWQALRRAKAVDLRAVMKYAEPAPKRRR